MVCGYLEDRFKDTVTDKTCEHPVQSDENHRTIGVIDHDVGMYPIEHFAKIDKGKKSEQNGREIG